MTATSISVLWTRSSLSARILIGLGLGIATGLFLGELAQPLELLSSAYIRLMQMTVVPYMAVALIVGMGQLTLDQARLLASRGLLLLVLFWGIAFVILFLMPMAFRIPICLDFCMTVMASTLAMPSTTETITKI